MGEKYLLLTKMSLLCIMIINFLKTVIENYILIQFRSILNIMVY